MLCSMIANKWVFIQFEVFMNTVESILYWHQQHALTQDYLNVHKYILPQEGGTSSSL